MIRNRTARRVLLVAALAAAGAIPAHAEGGETAAGPRRVAEYASCTMGIVTAWSPVALVMAFGACAKLYYAQVN